MFIACASLAIATVLASCNDDCAPSSDVRVELDGDAGALSQVKSLAIGIAVNGGKRGVDHLDLTGALSSGQALLLQSTAPIDGFTYMIAVDVTGLGADGSVVVTGKTSANVGTSACNRVSIDLVGLGNDLATGGDASMPPEDLAGLDLAGVDQSMMMQMPDLAPCTATTPDEDGDGRGDACDVCAANADSTIVDGDSDGVPDVCDPAPAATGNHVVYFQPFNAMPAGWNVSGSFTVTNGSLEISGSAAGLGQESMSIASDPAAPLPGGVMMQTYVTPMMVNGDLDGGIRIALWTQVGSSGILCEWEHRSVGSPTLIVRELGVGNNGVGVTPTPTAGQSKRMRFSIHGTTATCELADPNGGNAATAMLTLSAAPAGPLRPGLGVGFQGYSDTASVTADFSSIFAVSYP
jgi:hypothetical protein